MIKKAIFKSGAKLESCRFAPYAGDTVFIINDEILIFNDENEKGYVWIKPELLNDIIDRLNLLSEAVRLLIKEKSDENS
jgi:hypothetical protein